MRTPSVWETKFSKHLDMSEISPILVLPTKKTNKMSDMTKVAIKNESITSFGRINHIMDVFSNLAFEKLTESVLGRRGCSGKAFSYGSILSSLFFSYLCVKIVQNISMRLQDSSIRVLAHCYLMLTLPILNIYQDLQWS